MNKTILIASDSYKSSLDSSGVNNAIESGLKKVFPNYKYVKVSVADGGEGTIQSLIENVGGDIITHQVHGAMGELEDGQYGIINNEIAILETASPLGLHRLNRNNLNPNMASSYGLGEMIIHAMDNGMKELYIGLGGSSTNDGGFGMARALGAKFYDKDGNEIYKSVKELINLDHIDISNLNPKIFSTKFILLSDVNNPLCGKTGATYVYGPQKGVKTDELDEFDDSIMQFGKVLETTFNKSIINEVSAGAAGGLGGGLMAFCDAKVESGIDKFLELSDFDTFLKSADFVITGEGQMDYQSAFGKAPVGIAKFAKKFNIPVFAIVGSTGVGIEQVYDHGIDLIFDIVNRPMTLDESINNAYSQIQLASIHCAQAIKLINDKTANN